MKHLSDIKVKETLKLCSDQMWLGAHDEKSASNVLWFRMWRHLNLCCTIGTWLGATMKSIKNTPLMEARLAIRVLLFQHPKDPVIERIWQDVCEASAIRIAATTTPALIHEELR